MKKSKKAFSLIIAIGLVMISVLLAITIVDYMIPFSRTIRGVENATASYYLAYSGIENGLFYFKGREAENERDDTSYSTGSIYNIGYGYFTSSSGTILPALGTGNSDYDPNWNTISMGDSIQLSVGHGALTNLQNLAISFRVPDLNNDSLHNEQLAGDKDDILINWQIASETETLSSMLESMITIGEINYMTTNTNSNVAVMPTINLSARNGREVTSTGAVLASNFYDRCFASGKCIIRFSVVNPMKQSLLDNTVPYLEWRIATNESIALRYSRIESTGNMYGYSRKLVVRYPQDTIPEALDFAIFQ